MAERLNLSVDERVARRVRQCGARSRGGQSGYVERLVRQDELREAGAAIAKWYAENPALVDDAEAERTAAIDGAD